MSSETTGEYTTGKLPLGMAIGDNTREFTIDGLEGPEAKYVHRIEINSISADDGISCSGDLTVTTDYDIETGSSSGYLLGFALTYHNSGSPFANEYSINSTVEEVVVGTLAGKVRNLEANLNLEEAGMQRYTNVMPRFIKLAIGSFAVALAAAPWGLDATMNQHENQTATANLSSSVMLVAFLSSLVCGGVALLNKSNRRYYQSRLEKVNQTRTFYKKLADAATTHGITIISDEAIEE